MKVTKVYKEDDCILVEVSGWPEALILPNHVDNRRFMNEFNKPEPTLGLPLGCTFADLKSIGFELKDYDGYQYLEKNCTIEVTAHAKDLSWYETKKGKYWTSVQCNVEHTGLHPKLTQSKICLLHKKSYDKNPDLKLGKYTGICKAMITDDSKLDHVCFIMFMNTYDTCAQAEEWFKLIEDEEVTN